MNENKMIYYTKIIFRLVGVCLSCVLLIYLLKYMTDLEIWLKSILLIGLLGAMFLNIYNGRENRYNDFKQPIEGLSKLDTGSFTYFIERLYRTLGYYTKVQGKPNKLKDVQELVLIKGQEQIIMQCYNKETISLEAVQHLVGRMSFYPSKAKGQILFLGIPDEKVQQLAHLNNITIIEGHQLKKQMTEAAEFLEGYLDGAISAFWCHPLRWFRKHFLEDEPRFMNDKPWCAWIKLKLQNIKYEISDTQSPKEYGVQFVAVKEGESIAVRCIGIDHKVTTADLNALKASIPFYQVHKAILFTNSHISHEEKSLAKRLHIQLLTFDDCLKWFSTQK